MKIYVTPEQFAALWDASHKRDVYGWSDGWWYGRVKSILGGDCPAPYTGPHDVVVAEFQDAPEGVMP